MAKGKRGFRLEVDGEVFTVVAGRTASQYEWVSGPNAGYGFGSARSDRARPTMEEHEEAIRDFLSMVDPETGFVE